MLKHRLQSGFIMGAALLLAAFFLPPSGVLVVLLLVCAAATWELFSILDAADIPNFKALGTVAGVALVGITWATLHHNGTDDGEWVVLAVAVLLVFVRQFPQKHNERPLETMATTLFGIMYVPFLFNFLTKLIASWDGQDGRFLVVYLIVVVKFTDIGAYFIGCAIGKHKMFPRISPAKSWEGGFGGVITGVAASLVYFWITEGHLGVVTLSLTHAIVLGILLSVAGILGDLAESLIKRAGGVKDSSNVIQGMGGTLDLLDSLLFAAPVLYVYARALLPPV